MKRNGRKDERDNIIFHIIGKRGVCSSIDTISRKVAGSSPHEVLICLSIYLILPAALSPGDYSASNRNEHQKMFLGSRARPVRRAGLTAICEPIV
jgi:hypothetical protein